MPLTKEAINDLIKIRTKKKRHTKSLKPKKSPKSRIADPKTKQPRQKHWAKAIAADNSDGTSPGYQKRQKGAVCQGDTGQTRPLNKKLRTHSEDSLGSGSPNVYIRKHGKYINNGILTWVVEVPTRTRLGTRHTQGHRINKTKGHTWTHKPNRVCNKERTLTQ
jgi:hypothetical protein